jgi:hypothetical protein
LPLGWFISHKEVKLQVRLLLLGCCLSDYKSTYKSWHVE